MYTITRGIPYIEPQSGGSRKLEMVAVGRLYTKLMRHLVGECFELRFAGPRPQDKRTDERRRQNIDSLI